MAKQEFLLEKKEQIKTDIEKKILFLKTKISESFPLIMQYYHSPQTDILSFIDREFTTALKFVTPEKPDGFLISYSDKLGKIFLCQNDDIQSLNIYASV